MLGLARGTPQGSLHGVPSQARCWMTRTAAPNLLSYQVVGNQLCSLAHVAFYLVGSHLIGHTPPFCTHPSRSQFIGYPPPYLHIQHMMMMKLMVSIVSRVCIILLAGVDAPPFQPSWAYHLLVDHPPHGAQMCPLAHRLWSCR